MTLAKEFNAISFPLLEFTSRFFPAISRSRSRDQPGSLIFFNHKAEIMETLLPNVYIGKEQRAL
jgi:hypothetical protein